MKTLKLLFGIVLTSLFISSCSVEIIDEHPYTPTQTLHQKLSSYDLWYVDIHQTMGNGEVPFIQRAFTLSFRGDTVYANNNLAGIGATGNGYGIPIGYFGAYANVLEVNDDLFGFYALEVYQINANKIELYHPPTNTSYFLYGYMRHNFNYDQVFYDNIHYFLQEYEAWEKVATLGGVENEFDAENFLQFLPSGNNGDFKSSQDVGETPVHNLYWDYTGLYNVANFSDTNTVKALTLDYDYFADEYFELSVITDNEIELYHPSSDTAYRFVGRNFIQFKTTDNQDKKRIKIITEDFGRESSKRDINPESGLNLKSSR